MTANGGLIFIDLEASSFAGDSYPVEIGWVDESGQGQDHLIRAEAAWTDWSDVSESVHGISRQTLMTEGKAASDVAHSFLAAVKDRRVVSDAPEFDRAWLGRLLATIGHDAPRVLSVQTIWGETIRTQLNPNASRDEQAGTAQRMLQTAMLEARYEEPRHRAMADAKALWLVWRRLVGAAL